ncbi:TPA: flagellar basal body P-ring protein FlgI [Candidatus Poribacteria bacterium]|nr:flagellar basal body P-ring protein FlgI [Candidatus Poribacteria bacterium]
MKKIISLFVCISIITISFSQQTIGQSQMQVRIKDIVSLDGIYEAKLLGIGVVTGLSNTGDKQNNEVTQRFLENIMREMGVSITLSRFEAKNMAAVTVTATLPPFAKVGSQIDVQVESFQNATSLQGGTLLPTPLLHTFDLNKEVYLMASGVISIGGYGAGKGGDRIQKNHLTAGNIPNGGVVHKAMRVDVFQGEQITLVPYHADYTTVTKIVERINENENENVAVAIDSGSIQVNIPARHANADPARYTDNVVRFVSEIGALTVEVDRPATVIVDERTGTVVIGSNVTISNIAITHGGLTVTVGSEQEISQPTPMSQGETFLLEETEVTIEEKGGVLTSLPDSVTIDEVVSALNALGATPRELISILQNIERVGALHAKLIIR